MTWQITVLENKTVVVSRVLEIIDFFKSKIKFENSNDFDNYVNQHEKVNLN